MAKMQNTVWWPTMRLDVQRYCDACIRCKGAPTEASQQLRPIYSYFPNDLVGVDFFGPFKPSREGYKYAVMMTDAFSKFIRIVPALSPTAEETANIVVGWFCDYGTPARMLTDKGSNFTSKLLRCVARRFGVEHILCTTAHHETNGQAERMIRTVSEMMRACLDGEKDWAEMLPFFAYAFNASVHSATQEVPYFLWFGRMPSALTELEADFRTRDDYRTVELRSYGKQLWRRQIDAIMKLRRLQDKIKQSMRVTTDNHKRLVNLDVGDLCWLFQAKIPKLDSNGLVARRAWRPWTGPYFVVELDGANAVISNGKSETTQTVHRNRLRRYVHPIFGLEPSGDSPNAYLEKVTDVRVENGQKQYECTWRTVNATYQNWTDASLVPAYLVSDYEKYIAERRVLPHRGAPDPHD